MSLAIAHSRSQSSISVRLTPHSWFFQPICELGDALMKPGDCSMAVINPVERMKEDRAASSASQALSCWNPQSHKLREI
jgi:hypothetical protein